MIQITGIQIDHARVREGARGHMAKGSAPVISWAAMASRAGDTQSAYRVRAAQWDSGWVESAENGVRLPEGTLPEGKGSEVTVEIRTAGGDVSPAYTEIVYNAHTDFNAPWIGRKGQDPDRPLYVRGRVDLPEDVKNVRMYACGLGFHQISVNGARLDEAFLDPAITDYSKRVCYVFYPEAGECFRAGENEILAVVGAGWRGITNFKAWDFWKERGVSFYGDVEFSAIIEAECADGSVLRFETGADWETGTGPMTYANLYNGTCYDANEELSLRPADVLIAPAGKMEPMVLPPVLAQNALAPVAFWPDGEDAVVLDFGQNLAGVLRLLLPDGLKKGQKITLTHTEELREDGTLFPDTLRSAKATDTYIASGDGRDLTLWQIELTYHGFRYARIEGLTAAFDPRDVRALTLTTDVRADSFFRCGNALVTRLHELCVATEESNIHSILTDCPQRDERLGWMNDATVRFEETPYNFDVGSLFPKIIRDLMDIQTEEGAIGCTAPFVFGSKPADPVCSSFLVAGFEAALHTGNLDVIAEAYPAYEAWENCLLAHSDGYIVNYSYYGDWAGPLDCCVPQDNGGPGAVSAVTPGIFMSTGFSYLNCRLLEQFAKWLGKEGDAKRHAETAEQIKQAMLDKWYDAETGKFATGSQACQAFALHLGIAPDVEKAALRLHEALAAAGGRLTTGNLCSRYILDALCENGYVEDAWALMTREEYPSLGFMLQQEATTIWERFELMKDASMNSHNHPMYAAADYWMYAYLAGIRCTDVGWKRFLVKPVLPEKLMSAQAAVETPLGQISVRWVKRYGACHLQVNVPFGAQADLDFCGVQKTVSSGFHTLTVNL